MIDLQAPAHRQRQVGDEHIGLAHQAVQHRQTLGRQTSTRLLVASVQFPEIPLLGVVRASGSCEGIAPAVRPPPSPEIRQDRAAAGAAMKLRSR
jgi:hypothetical protein